MDYSDWGKGIAKNHYLGVANLRNVRIDDAGVLRVMNKPQKITDIPGEILNIESSYSDIENNWFAVIGSVGDTLGGQISPLLLGSGGLYQSKNQSFLISSFGDAWSGGIPYRNYFIPFPAIIGEDIGYLEDTDNDGDFDSQTSTFEILVTKGNTQTKFIQQNNLGFGGLSIEMLDDDTYVVEVGSDVLVKDKDGTINATISSITGVRDIARLSDTEFVIVKATELLVYNTSGTLLDTLSYDFAGGDELRHLEAKHRTTDQILVLEHTRDGSEDRVQFRQFNWNGTSLSTGNSKTVFPFTYNSFTYTGLVSDTPHIGVINGGDVVTIHKNIDFGNAVQVFEGSTFTQSYASYESTDFYSDAEYGTIAGVDGTDQFVMFGAKTSIYSWDDSANEILLLDDTLVSPNNVSYVGYAGDYYAIISGTNYAVYKLTQGELNKTHAIVGIDDIIYYSNGNSVGTITEEAGQVFDPSDSNTYTVNTDALDLPVGAKINGIAEVGEYIAISTEGGKIYYWDRLADTFEIPVQISDTVGAIGSKNNILYIASQGAGNAYIANLSSYEKLRNFSSLTPYRFDTQVADIGFFDDGAYMSAWVENDPTYGGIWIYRNGAWTILGTDSPVTAIGKGSRSELVYATEDGIYVQDISGQPTAEWTNDDAFMVSPMEIRGTVTSKGKPTTYSMYFDNSFQESEYVKIYYRTTTNGAWNLVQNVTSEQLVESTGLHAFKGQLSVPAVEQIQYKIVLNTTSALVLFDTR